MPDNQIEDRNDGTTTTEADTEVGEFGSATSEPDRGHADDLRNEPDTDEGDIGQTHAAEAESGTTSDRDDSDDADGSARTAVGRGAVARRIVGSARRALPFVAALLLVALAVATGVLGWKLDHSRDIDAAAAAALRAASDYAVTLTSVDTANLDADFTAVLDGSTGEFRDVYTKSSSQLRQLLIDHKAAGHGTVLQAAVKSATEREVVVLLFVDQSVSNTEMPDPRIDRSRIVMTMQNIDGRWKAAKVDIP